MCTGRPPSSVGEALAGLRASLAFLNQVAAADLPGVVQAGCLRELARAESAYTRGACPDAGRVRRQRRA